MWNIYELVIADSFVFYAYGHFFVFVIVKIKTIVHGLGYDIIFCSCSYRERLCISLNTENKAHAEKQ